MGCGAVRKLRSCACPRIRRRVFIEHLFDDPARWATHAGIVVASIVLHELGHGLVATWQGDPTPRIRGHITWNPVVHMGWLALGLVAFFGIGFGRTPVTPAYFRNRRWGETLVALAGPGVNLLLATVAAATIVLLLRVGDADPRSYAIRFWDWVLFLNTLLFLFNLIPLPPFDGFHALEGAFDLGNLGTTLRALGWYPMILAFVLASTPAFGAAVRDLSEGLVRLFALILAG